MVPPLLHGFVSQTEGWKKMLTLGAALTCKIPILFLPISFQWLAPHSRLLPVAPLPILEEPKSSRRESLRKPVWAWFLYLPPGDTTSI